MQEKFLNTLAVMNKSVHDQSTMEQPIQLPSYVQSLCQDHPDLYNTLQKCVRSEQDINAVDEKGLTPLLYAIQTGSTQLVNFVLSLNADPNPSDEAKMPPLIAAIKQQSKAVFETLLACERTDVNQLHSNTGISALCAATEAGYEDLVTLLLDKGAQPINPIFAKFLPLIHSAIHNKHGEIAILLLKKFPDLIYTRDQEGKTPLHAAVYYQCPKLVDYLLTIPDSLNPTDFYCRTPLWIAACLGDDLTIGTLIAHGADYAQGNKDSNGKQVPPIEIAARQGHVNVVSLLINYPHQLEALSKAQHYATSGMLQSLCPETRANLNACANIIHQQVLVQQTPKILSFADAKPSIWDDCFEELFGKIPSKEDAHPNNKDAAIRKALAYFLNLLNDPKQCLAYLLHINHLLEASWSIESKQPFPKFDKSRVDFWQYQNRLWPIPNEAFEPISIDKLRLLARVLIDVLQQNGMGFEQSKWTGFVIDSLANELLGKNAFFTENRRNINGWFHGNMHNIQRVILLLAILCGDIPISYTNERGEAIELSIPEIFAALVRNDLSFNKADKTPCWGVMLDSFSLEIMNFRQPHLLHAVIVGAEELNNTMLQDYMLWSDCHEFKKLLDLHNRSYKTSYNTKEFCEQVLSKIQTHLFGGIPEFAIQKEERSLEKVATIDEIKKEELRDYAVHQKTYAPLSKSTELPLPIFCVE